MKRQAAKISHINLRQTQILWCTALTVSAAAADLHVETERIRPWWDRVQLHLYGTAKVESTVQRAANPNQFPKVPPNHHNGISDSRHKGATIIKWHKNGVHADYLKIIVIQCTGCHFYWQHNGKKNVFRSSVSSEFKQVTLWLLLSQSSTHSRTSFPFTISVWRQHWHVASVQRQPITRPAARALARHSSDIEICPQVFNKELLKITTQYFFFHICKI